MGGECEGGSDTPKAHYPSAEDAWEAAGKKIKHKLSKGYIAAVIGEQEKQLIKRRAKPTLEEQLANLAACGVSLRHEMNREVLFSEWSEDHFLKEPYLCLLIALGGETDDDEAPGFLSENIRHFDTECIEDHGDYARIAMRMMELAGEDLLLEAIEDYVNVDEGQAWLAFKLNNQNHKWTLAVDNDWVDTDIFSRFDALLRAGHAHKRFTYLDLQGQDCLIGCSTAEQMENLRMTTGLNFRWLCE